MTPTKMIEWNQLLVGEILTVGLIGKSFYVYPERAWLQSLRDRALYAEAPFASKQPDVIAALQTLLAWSEENRAGLSDAAFDELRADYTRLFIGPGTVLAPPWESVHFSEERLTFQQQTLDVREWYWRFGLQAEKIHQEPDDHIGLQLEFIAHLARLGLAALEQDDPDALQKTVQAQREFLTEHLLCWGPMWCDLIETSARTDFYRGMARLCKGVLLELAAVLQGKV